MTIRVTVKNEDVGERYITVEQQDADGSQMQGAMKRILKGGESAEHHVHSGNRLVVTETDDFGTCPPTTLVAVESDPTSMRCVIQEMIEDLRKSKPTRESSLAVTKLQEAFFWLDEVNRLS